MGQKITVDIDSLLVWYPKIKDLPIPQPKTEIIILSDDELKSLREGKVSPSIVNKIKIIGDKLGYPLFIRTDLASNKFEWDRSCFVSSTTDIARNIGVIVEFNLSVDVMQELNFRVLVVREYIPMDSKYTAFYGNMPVCPERRYFLESEGDGTGIVTCHHPYWIEEAVVNPSVPNWKELSKEMNKETEAEVDLLADYCGLLMGVIKGYWSVDFCRAKDGRWILIDMAQGGRSWHSKKCRYNRTIEIDYGNLNEDKIKYLEDERKKVVEIDIDELYNLLKDSTV